MEMKAVGIFDPGEFHAAGGAEETEHFAIETELHRAAVGWALDEAEHARSDAGRGSQWATEIEHRDPNLTIDIEACEGRLADVVADLFIDRLERRKITLDVTEEKSARTFIA